MSSPNKSQPKKTMGRRKVNMEKMEKQSNLQVTFSKRRAGLFKKASELCTLSGAEVAIVVFSPGRKAYSFGHPNVNTIIERYSLQLPRGPANNRLPRVQSDSPVMELTQLESLLEKEKSRAHELDKASKTMQRQKCIPSIDTLDLQQLNHLKLVLQNLENNFQARVQNVTKPMTSNLGTGGGYPSVPHHFVNYDFSPAPGSDQGTNGGENDDDTSQELETGYGRRFF